MGTRKSTQAVGRIALYLLITGSGLFGLPAAHPASGPLSPEASPLTVRWVEPRLPGPLDTALLPNGNFEQGAAVWAQSSVQALDLIRKLSEIGITPHSGQWGAVLGILNNELASIEQRVTVPTGSPTLNYWYLMGSTDTHLGSDFARLLIDGSVVDEFQLYEGVATSVWTLHSIDLSAYAGRTVDVQIQVEIDVAEPSTLVIDDVFFDFDGSSGAIFRDGFESGDTSAWSGSVP